MHSRKGKKSWHVGEGAASSDSPKLIPLTSAPGKPMLKDLGALSDSFRKFLFSEKLSDVQIQLDSGDLLPAHRHILAMQSPFFENLFFGGMKESTEAVVRLPEVSKEAMCCILEYCYSGIVSEVPVSVLMEVFCVSHRFDIEPLVKLCSAHLCTNFGPVFKDKEHITLPEHLMASLLSQDELDVGCEEEAFFAALSWAQEAHKKRPDETLAEVAEVVMSQIRFQQFTPAFIYEQVEPTEAVIERLLIDAYRAKALPDRVKSLPPRKSYQFPQGGSWTTLLSWTGKSSSKLLYNSAIHGLSSKAFHDQCKGYAGQMFIITTADGYCFGAFTSLDVTSLPFDSYAVDTSSFLFQMSALSQEQLFQLTLVTRTGYNAGFYGQQFPIANNNHVCHAQNGVSFGGSPDLLIQFDDPSSSGSYLGSSSSTYCHSSGASCDSSFLAGKQTGWDVANIKVFHIF